MAVVIPFHRAPATWPPADCCGLDSDASRPMPLKRSPVFGRIASAISTYRRRRAAIRTLRSLDDRLLRDIGVGREDIGAMVDALLAGGAVTHGRVIATCTKKPADW
jgi:uncharacterized protein YjiS (DUF1127 family)